MREMLKPMLAEEGTSLYRRKPTLDEYRQYIEKDAAPGTSFPACYG